MEAVEGEQTIPSMCARSAAGMAKERGWDDGGMSMERAGHLTQM
jgi:hypothetical protein